MRFFSLPSPFRTPALAALIAATIATKAPAQQSAHPLDVGVQYSYTRSNLLPGCDCFSLNGGSAQVQYQFLPRFSLLGDVSGTHRGGITPDGYQITQYTYTAGLRYSPLSHPSRARPFGELAVGGAHAAGSLSPAESGVGGSSNALALLTGGGLQLRVGQRWILQPVEVNYMLTTFNNGSANRQNDLRVTTGFLFRFSR